MLVVFCKTDRGSETSNFVQHCPLYVVNYVISNYLVGFGEIVNCQFEYDTAWYLSLLDDVNN